MPLPQRYKEETPEISKIWESESYFKFQMKIWKVQCQASSELYSKPSKNELQKIEKALSLTSIEIDTLTQAKGHETNKLLRLIQSKLPAEIGNFIHKGNTSSDVLDTSLALQIRESLELLKKDFEDLKKSFGKLALKHRKTLQVGRTHTQHAIPQTFGRQVVGWYAEILRGIERIERAREIISVGKLSGEIGTSVFIDSRLEEKTLRKLGLKPDEASTQIISRDRHAEVLSLISINASTLARIAENIRLLSMTEVGEVREPFGDQEGSSSMPHKRNPELSERIKGLSRIIRSDVNAELDSIIVWLERDISHSSTERFTFPDVFCGVSYASRLTKKIIDGLEVDSERMLSNLNLTYGSIYSSRLMNTLLESGKMSRTEAYEISKKLALEAMNEKTQMVDLVLKNKKIVEILGEKVVGQIFDPKIYLKNIDVAFKRVGLL